MWQNFTEFWNDSTEVAAYAVCKENNYFWETPAPNRIVSKFQADLYCLNSFQQFDYFGSMEQMNFKLFQNLSQKYHNQLKLNS